MKPLKTLLILFCLYACQEILAQDLHYSQFYSMPSASNPAFTGFRDDDYFVGAVYKTQWGSVSHPYQTVGAVAELSLLRNKLPNTTLGVGIEMVNDRAGSTSFTTNQFNVNVSLLQVLGRKRDHMLGVGFQTGMATRKFDLSKATFEGQFNGFDGFDLGLSSGETQLITKQADLNLGTGMMYAYSPGEHNKFYIGGAGYNLLSPNISFVEGSTVRQYKRYLVVAGGEVRISKQGWSLLPSVYFQKQGPHTEALFGTFVRYGKVHKKEEQFALDFGVWYRLKDALIPAIRAEYKGIILTYNFDINVSKLTEASNLYGSQEVSLVYSGKLFKTPKGKSSFKCPNLSF